MMCLAFRLQLMKTSTKTYERMKGDSRYRTFVADINGNVVEFATTVEALAIDHPNGYIKMDGLAILPEYQHRGIGKALMEHVEGKNIT